jgi:16S rRNA (guanine966-N2)-methyltransferase
MPDAGRVITGAARGIRLDAPGQGTRPLADRVKQALFSAIESELGGAWATDVLDLFAGSGAAGIEALSRGAPRAVFVERDARAARVIGGNLGRTGLAGGVVVRDDVLRFLVSPDSAHPAARGPFGVVVIDPPYGEPDLLAASLMRLGDPGRDWLGDDALVVSKHFWRTPPPPEAGRLSLSRARRFGETSLSFHRTQSVGTALRANPS